jgi:hypothetical protein
MKSTTVPENSAANEKKSCLNHPVSVTLISATLNGLFNAACGGISANLGARILGYHSSAAGLAGVAGNSVFGAARSLFFSGYRHCKKQSDEAKQINQPLLTAEEKTSTFNKIKKLGIATAESTAYSTLGSMLGYAMTNVSSDITLLQVTASAATGSAVIVGGLGIVFLGAYLCLKSDALQSICNAADKCEGKICCDEDIETPSPTKR